MSCNMGDLLKNINLPFFLSLLFTLISFYLVLFPLFGEKLAKKSTCNRPSGPIQPLPLSRFNPYPPYLHLTRLLIYLPKNYAIMRKKLANAIFLQKHFYSFLLVLLCSIPAFSQTEPGSIRGKVSD